MEELEFFGVIILAQNKQIIKFDAFFLNFVTFLS